MNQVGIFKNLNVRVKCAGENICEGDALNYKVICAEENVAQGTIIWDRKELEFEFDVVRSQIFNTNFHEEGVAWSPENPILFDVKLELLGQRDTITDTVLSYFGFRKVHTEKGMVYLNNKPYYQKLILDQGYWPDQMGFLVWGECASSIMYNQHAVKGLIDEWAEVIERDYNHPSIVAWVPINESWGVPNIHKDKMQQSFSLTMYYYLHAIDDTRLVISNDGWEMTRTDICAIHNYKHGEDYENAVYQEYKDMLATRESLISHPSTCWDIYANGYNYQGEPIMLTEFGGIGFDVSGESGWGYTSASSDETFVESYQKIMDAVYASKGLWGFCYTQLTDVEQEINGLLTYERKQKCNPKKIRQINDGYHISRIVEDRK